MKNNAIPVESVASIVVADEAAARDVVAEMAEAFKPEYHLTDPNLFVRAQAETAAQNPMDAETTGKVICMLTCLPNGIQAMSADIPGLVQTSPQPWHSDHDRRGAVRGIQPAQLD